MTDDLETSTEISSTENDAELESGPSVEDTVLAAYEELENGESEADENVSGGEGAETEKPTLSASEAASILARSKGQKGNKGRVGKAPKASVEPQGEPLAAAPVVEGQPGEQQKAEAHEPPMRWPVAAKEEFYKQPPLVQKQVAEYWKQVEGNATKAFQELSREQKRVADIEAVAEPYTSFFHERGMTREQGIAEAFATIKNMHADPIGTLAKVCQNAGVTPQQLHDFMQGGGQQTYQQPHVQSTQQKGLTADEVRTILQEESVRSQQQQLEVAAANEIRQVIAERDATGKFVYPELHDQGYLEGLQTLVSYLRKTQPSLSWGETYKRAVQLDRQATGKQNGSPSPNGQRLSQQEEINKVKAASVSVRGRGNPTVPTNGAVRGEKVEETVRRAFEQLSRE